MKRVLCLTLLVLLIVNSAWAFDYSWVENLKLPMLPPPNEGRGKILDEDEKEFLKNKTKVLKNMTKGELKKCREDNRNGKPWKICSRLNKDSTDWIIYDGKFCAYDSINNEYSVLKMFKVKVTTKYTFETTCTLIPDSLELDYKMKRPWLVGSKSKKRASVKNVKKKDLTNKP